MIFTEYMENKCGDTIDVGSLNSVRLQLNEYWSQGTDSCQLSVKTSSESKIMFYFKVRQKVTLIFERNKKLLTRKYLHFFQDFFFAGK